MIKLFPNANVKLLDVVVRKCPDGVPEDVVEYLENLSEHCDILANLYENLNTVTKQYLVSIHKACFNHKKFMLIISTKHGQNVEEKTIARMIHLHIEATKGKKEIETYLNDILHKPEMKNVL